jgi:hypothetical protein
MTPELLDLYQELVASTSTMLPDGWTMFSLKATYDGSLLQLSLSSFDEDAEESEVTPVPSPLFAVVRKIRSATGQQHEWTGMYLDYMIEGTYDVQYKYDDTRPAAR